MKKHSALIIDDEKNIREALTIMMAQNCPDIHIAGVASSAQEGRELLKKENVDLIFLDISMPKEDGFAFLESIPSNNYAVIFATAHQEYALRALKSNAIDYLLKPINPLELQDAVSKAVYNLELRKSHVELHKVYIQSLKNIQEFMQLKSGPLSQIVVVEQNGFKMVKVGDLVYLEADSNYTILHIWQGRNIVATRTLGEFERLLENPEFFRIHKSSIINLYYLTEYSNVQGNFALMKDGSKLSISRRKIVEFREKVKQFSLVMD